MDILYIAILRCDWCGLAKFGQFEVEQKTLEHKKENDTLTLISSSPAVAKLNVGERSRIRRGNFVCEECVECVGEQYFDNDSESTTP